MPRLLCLSAAFFLVANSSMSLSAGIVSSEPGQIADLETLYKSADTALYREKHGRPAASDEANPLARTGTWKL